MTFDELRALWLVARREYVQRVKSLSFVTSTLAAPILFLAAVSVPALLARPQPSSPAPIVVVCTTPESAAEIAETFRHWRLGTYRAEIVVGASPQERQKLTKMVRESRIEGFLWLDKDALASGRAVFASRSGLNSFASESLYSITYRAVIRARLVAWGLSAEGVNRFLQPVVLDSVSVAGPVTKSDNAVAAIVATVAIITTLETSLLLYGIIVMRSVLEDKTSRVVEILLCSVTPRALMAGKILGIGGLSLTQVAIWGTIAAALIAAVAPMLGGNLVTSSIALGPGSVVLLVLFYVLGYLLYSSLYAALGAAFNSADEAQYWSFILTIPMLFAGIAAWTLFAHADSALAIVLSLVPPLTPVIMGMRVAAGAVPGWQIGLSLGLMAAAVYAAGWVSAQIYRVGTLMYGKKPRLREVRRWLRYA